MKKTSSSRARPGDQLFPLMFEMGRLLKHQFSVDGYGPSSYLHLETLRHLREAGTLDMGAVAGYLRVAAPSATALVNALARDGLIIRKPDAQDRRRVLLSVSAKGVRTLEDAAKRREAAFARLTAPLSAADRKEMARILTIITKR
ncbi:MAG TPA: MarR family transcriptional regulator [Candidatus Paceibacterota bacterium]